MTYIAQFFIMLPDSKMSKPTLPDLNLLMASTGAITPAKDAAPTISSFFGSFSSF